MNKFTYTNRELFCLTKGVQITEDVRYMYMYILEWQAIQLTMKPKRTLMLQSVSSSSSRIWRPPFPTKKRVYSFTRSHKNVAITDYALVLNSSKYCLIIAQKRVKLFAISQEFFQHCHTTVSALALPFSLLTVVSKQKLSLSLLNTWVLSPMKSWCLHCLGYTNTIHWEIFVGPHWKKSLFRLTLLKI